MANSTTMYNPPKPGSKIIIVGGGAFGLSTAYALALKNKYDVWVYDRQSIPAPDAASTGKKEERIKTIDRYILCVKQSVAKEINLLLSGRH